MALLTVNGTELYYELRGGGLPVLLIMGFTGDGGNFKTLAGLLADEFTVICYDRRGNGRSPRPAGWATTSPEEQADDAAALLTALGLAPAAVYGSSAGATFTLCLLIRNPEVVRGAVLHEPALVRLFDDPGARGAVTAVVREGMRGPAGPRWHWSGSFAGWLEMPTGNGSSPHFGSACGQRPRPSSGSSWGAMRGSCPMMRRWRPLLSR